MENIEKAARLLKENDLTCAICGEGIEYTSMLRGVQPLLRPYEEGKSFVGCSAADRVIGKAAACLYVLLGVEHIYAGIVSKPAKEIFEKNGIALDYDMLVELIENRDRTGLCPMETAVIDVVDPQEAPGLIRKALEKLRE